MAGRPKGSKNQKNKIIEEKIITTDTIAEPMIAESEVVLSSFEKIGANNSFQLICKTIAKTEGWEKTTRALEVPKRGCFVQIENKQKNPNGDFFIAQSLTFAPGVGIVKDEDTGNNKLVSIHIG